MRGGKTMNWPDLTREVARFADVPADSIERDTRLIEDLGLDSLALTELLVTLIEAHDLDSLAEELVQRSWENVSAGELYELYCAPGGSSAGGGAGGQETVPGPTVAEPAS